MNVYESREMYLETILVLSSSSSVRSIDVAAYMGYSKPSVSRAIGLLKKDGLVNMDESGYLTLTAEGEAKAKTIYERHTLLSKLLVNLGVSEATAAEDACRIEHYISEETFDAIKRHVKQFGSENGAPTAAPCEQHKKRPGSPCGPPGFMCRSVQITASRT